MSDNELHEGMIEYMLTCHDPSDTEYLCSTPIKEPDMLKHNLKEGDKVLYSIDSEGYAVIKSRVDIVRIIETV